MSGDNTNVPEVITIDQGQATTSRIRWKDNAYHVAILGQVGAPPVDLPPEIKTIKPADIDGHKNTLIFSERSGGARDFLLWWKERLNDTKEPWVMVQGSAWNQALFEYSGQSGESTPDKKIMDLIYDLGNEEGIPKRVYALRRLAEERPDPFTLIIRDPTALDGNKAIDLATAFRSIRDLGISNNLKILIASTSEAVFEDKFRVSGYLPLCHQYRIPGLTLKEVQTLALVPTNDKKEASLGLDTEAAACFMQHTGGQPLLVQHLLLRLRQELIKEKRDHKREEWIVEPDLVNRAARLMRTAPPDRVRLWQDELEKLLKKDPELLYPMAAYVAGETRGSMHWPRPVNERVLYIAGWLKCNHLGRWGITSTLHAHLARPILDKIERGQA